MTFNVNTSFKIKPTPRIIQELGLQNGGKIQRVIDTEVVRLCDKYTPWRDGDLKKALGTVFGSGKVKYNVPYAKVNYYFNQGKGKGGTAYGGFRGRLWLERMKAAKGETLAKSIKRLTDVAKAIWHG